MYYPSSENKGADQLRGNREADLRLCFRLCRLLVFPWGGSNITLSKNTYEPSCGKTNNLGFQPTPTQISLYSHRWRLEA